MNRNYLAKNETEKPEALQLAEMLEVITIFPEKPVKTKRECYLHSQFPEFCCLIFHKLKMTQ